MQGLKLEQQAAMFSSLPRAEIDINDIFSDAIQPRSGHSPAGASKKRKAKMQGAKGDPCKWKKKTGGKRRKVSCSYCHASKKRCEGALEDGCLACVKKGIKCEPHARRAPRGQRELSKGNGGGMGMFFGDHGVDRPPLQKFYTKQFRSLEVQTDYSWLKKQMPFLTEDEQVVEDRQRQDLQPIEHNYLPLQLMPRGELEDSSTSDSETSNDGEQQVDLDAEFFNLVVMGTGWKEMPQGTVDY
jgi:hypothetical protein